MENSLLKSLSDEQLKPFTRTTPNASILAAAGSGKTHTLTHLLLADLESGIPASGIVAFTFTEKAADELLSRIHLLSKKNLPNVNLDGIFIGTIHSWCLRYLSDQSDFYNFMPMDEVQVDAFVSRFYDQLHLNETYGLTYPFGIKNFLTDLDVFYNENLEIDQAPEVIKKSIASFLDLILGNRLMTFGDMIRFTIRHLKQNGPDQVLQSLYVDEYQDVNPAQVELIKSMLPTSTAKLIVVGDDLQCIYNWRGSDITRILRFMEEFPDSSVFRLSDNYRSRPDIVEFGNSIAENIQQRDKEKKMVAKRPPLNYKVVNWISTDSQQDQAEKISNIINMLKRKGVQENKIAILLRSVVSDYGREIVQELSSDKNDIKVNCPILNRGGLFINEFILPLFDWLKSVPKDPSSMQEEEEIEAANNALWERAKIWINKPADDAEDKFWDAATDWKEKVNKSHNDAYDVRGRLYDLFFACGISISPDDTDLLIGLGIASQIIRSVEEIHRLRVKGHNRRTARGVLTEVYFALGRMQEKFGESQPINTKVDGVVVTTVHQAKGLEWPVVILPMLVRNCFPLKQSRHKSSFPDDIVRRYGTSTEDEKRLFYVASTRAKERLFLVEPCQHTEVKRSQFLLELQLQKVISPVDIAEISLPVWKIDPQDLEEKDSPPIRIGLSDLLLYIECPYQYGLRRYVGIQPSVGEELGYGKGLHELIQRRFEAPEAWNANDLDNQVAMNVSLPYMSEQAEAQSKQAIKDRIICLEELGAFDAQVETEVNIDVTFPSGIVHGVIDLIQINDDGSSLVRDWKSSLHESLIPRYVRQLQFYTMALKQQGRNIQRADLVDVSKSKQEGKIVTYEVSILDSDLEGIRSSFETAITRISLGDFLPTPSSAACQSCDMFRICSWRLQND